MDLFSLGVPVSAGLLTWYMDIITFGINSDDPQRMDHIDFDEVRLLMKSKSLSHLINNLGCSFHNLCILGIFLMLRLLMSNLSN